MTAWVMIGVVFAALWLFWFGLGALFDWITAYHREHAVADRSGEDAPPTKGTGSSVMQQPYSSSQRHSQEQA